MPDEIVAVLDRALVSALWVFLAVLSVLLAGSFLILRQKNRTILKGLQRRFERDKPGESPDRLTAEAWGSYLKRWDPVRAGLGASLWSVSVALAVFLFLGFSPWTGIVGVSTEPPLRVTWLYVEPTPEGFRIEGDVWNQSKEPLSVRASVVLLDASGKELGGATASIEPGQLKPRDEGAIRIAVGTCPGASDFTLRFLGEDGRTLHFAKGFPGTADAQGHRTDQHVRRITK
ncbi:MAG: hypothetical protein EHM23_00080 [Acidobacteria bacterium]|nr:MAG: hypothetical protein EHM23_00080 [Acidobacteriota bacterium]